MNGKKSSCEDVAFLRLLRPQPPPLREVSLIVSEPSLLRFITWPNYKGKWNQLQCITNRGEPLGLFCSIWRNMINSNYFHAWLKTHEDNKGGLWMWSRCRGKGRVWNWWLDRIQIDRKHKSRKGKKRERVVLVGVIGLKRMLAFPLGELLMPYWMQLLMKRWAVCGPCDQGPHFLHGLLNIRSRCIRAGRGETGINFPQA